MIAPRHLLPVALLGSVAAAFGARAIARRLPRPAAVIAGGALALYLVANAIGAERLYTSDVRHDAATWIEENVPPGEPVTTFLDWSRVGNVRKIEGPAARDSRVESNWFVTYDVEFRRYYRGRNAKNIYHAFGGERRLRFFRDLFAGGTEFEPAVEFREHAFTPEQRLIRLGVLRHIETFTAKRYIVFRRRGGTSSPLAPSPAP